MVFGVGSRSVPKRGRVASQPIRHFLAAREALSGSSMHLFPSKASTDLSLYSMRKRDCLWVRLSYVLAERPRRQRMIVNVRNTSPQLRSKYSKRPDNFSMRCLLFEDYPCNPLRICDTSSCSLHWVPYQIAGATDQVVSHAEPLISANLVHILAREAVLLSVIFLALCATNPRSAPSIRRQELVSRTVRRTR